MECGSISEKDHGGGVGGGDVCDIEWMALGGSLSWFRGCEWERGEGEVSQ